MKQTHFILLAVATTAFALAVLARTGQEPTYNGRPLSFWVEENWLGGPKEAQALRTIGTNAFPFLPKWIKGELPLKLPELSDTHNFADATTRVFEALGDDAGPLVPELTRLANDPTSPEVAERCLQALAWMGNKGVPSLLAAVRNPKHPYRGRATFVLGSTRARGPEADAVITELVAAMSDGSINGAAAHALGELKLRPDIAVPALSAGLTNGAHNFRAICATSLIWFGQRAEPALPQLTNAFNDVDADVRQAASNAAWSIRNEVRKQQLRQ